MNRESFSVEIVVSYRVRECDELPFRLELIHLIRVGPDAEVAKGSRRKYTDNVAVAHMKRLLQAGKECQASLINYRKGGTPFINLVTVVPITWDGSEDIVYHVGFQVDLVEQPNAILRNMRDGSYQVNYMVQNNPQPPLKPAAKPVIEPPPPTSIGISKEMLDLLSHPAQQAVLAGGEEVGKHEWLKLVLSHTDGEPHIPISWTSC